MEQEKPMDELESFQIIQQMINTAKQEQRDNGKGWIVWGWSLFLTSLITIVNIKAGWFKPFFFWNIIGMITIANVIFEMVKGLFSKKTVRVKTYTRSLFDRLNAGFFILLIYIIFAINLGIGPSKGFSLLIGVYGFWMLIYGSALNFKPSIVAAYISWILGFVSLFQKDFFVVMIFHAAAVLIGYIIPGHIANREFKKLKGKGKLANSV